MNKLKLINYIKELLKLLQMEEKKDEEYEEYPGDFSEDLIKSGKKLGGVVSDWDDDDEYYMKNNFKLSKKEEEKELKKLQDNIDKFMRNEKIRRK